MVCVEMARKKWSESVAFLVVYAKLAAMELTEQWVAKTAGWKALKEGRELLSRCRVEEMEVKGELYTGRFFGAGKPFSVKVKVHSEFDVDTVCSRMTCRGKVGFCAHAAALMLAYLQGDAAEIASGKSAGERTKEKKEKEEKIVTPKPSKVELPPHFPKTLPKGMSVKEWSAEGAKPKLLSVRQGACGDYLRHIASGVEVMSGEERVRIVAEGVRVPMAMAREGQWLRCSMAREVREQGRVWLDGGELFVWDGSGKILLMCDVSSLWSPSVWQSLAEGQVHELAVSEYLRGREKMLQWVDWCGNEELAAIPVHTPQPQIELEIEGSLRELRARLWCRYAEGAAGLVTLDGIQGVEFPVVVDGVYLMRNEEAERGALAELQAAGFAFAESRALPEGTLRLRGELHILDFLTEVWQVLEQREYWQIQEAEQLGNIRETLVRVTPELLFENEEVVVPMQGSGEDWFVFDYQFKAASGASIPREVIRRMLAAGQRSGTSKNGKTVVLSAFDAEMMEHVLHDTNPQQKFGKFAVGKAQATYLRYLRAYYAGNANAKLSELELAERLVGLPEEVLALLREYQREGIVWLLDAWRKHGAALLADDMGLGKTLQTLAFVWLTRDQAKGKPSLVVCPRSLMGNWQAEVEKFFPEMRSIVLHGSKRHEQMKEIGECDLVITSYHLVARDEEFYQRQSFLHVILDEASVIRNPATQIARSVCRLKAAGRLALTGTPVENAARDLWSIFHYLVPRYLGTQKEFQSRYQQPLELVPPLVSALKRLRLRVAPFMLRRTKQQVAKDLPEKIEQTLYCELSPKQEEVYRELLEQGRKALSFEDNRGKAQVQMLTLLLRLRQASCHLGLLGVGQEKGQSTDLGMAGASGKLEMLMELLDEAQQGGHRVLVFSQFTAMLGLIREALEARGWGYSYLDGSTRNRTEVVRNFQRPDGPAIFLISLKAGGYGLNLTAADTVVHFDPWWNPAVEAQATDRAHRIGQTRPTTVYKMIARHTVEEKILNLQARKRDLIGATIGEDGEAMMQGLSAAEIQQLID